MHPPILGYSTLSFVNIFTILAMTFGVYCWKSQYNSSGGSKGRGHEGCAPPWGSKFFQFHAVFGEIWQNRMLAPGSATEFFEIPQLIYPSSFTIDLNKLRRGKVEFIYIIGTISWARLEFFLPAESKDLISCTFNVINLCDRYL